VVNFHTAFNVLLAVSLIFFTEPIARLGHAALAGRPAEGAGAREAPRRGLARDPALAASNAAREALRIADMIETMLAAVLTVIRVNDGRLAREVRRMDDGVDELYTAIKLYMTQVNKEALDERESRRWTEIMSFTINLEHIGDIVEQIIDDLEQKKISKGRSFSAAGMKEIEELHARLMASLRLGMNVFLNGDLQDRADAARAEGGVPRPGARLRAHPPRPSRLADAAIDRDELAAPGHHQRLQAHQFAISARSPIRSWRRPGCSRARGCARSPAKGTNGKADGPVLPEQPKAT
jgi:Na+/phosphate symporter